MQISMFVSTADSMIRGNIISAGRHRQKELSVKTEVIFVTILTSGIPPPVKATTKRSKLQKINWKPFLRNNLMSGTA
jgi:hypothetical protein